MRILFTSQHYWPEPFNIADMCEGLASRGHEVCVLTGIPNYPEGRAYPGYEHGQNRTQEREGVRVLRAPLIPRRHGIAFRVLNYYSFSFSSARIARKAAHGAGEGALAEPFDVVLGYQSSPVMMARPALAYARAAQVPLALYVADIWPECLLAGGIRRGSPVWRHYERVARRTYDAADRLLVSSWAFEGYLSGLLGRPSDATIVPQYAEDIFGCEHDRTAAAPEIARTFSADAFHLLFAGNVGSAQSVQTIIRAAAMLEREGRDERLVFHIAGSGSELDACQRLARERGVTSVVFHGRLPLEQMPALYALSDALVVTAAATGLVDYYFPRKVSTYLASGRPVLAAIGGDTRRVVEQAGCGLCCEVEDAVGLVRITRQLAGMDADARASMGAAARAFYEANLTRERFLDVLEATLLDLVEKPGEVRA